MRIPLPVLQELTDPASTPERAIAVINQHVNRRCGRCTGCCTGLAVEAISKPERTRCQHERTHRGCAIYTTRPEQCANFMCAWRMGIGTQKDIPSEIGVVFDVMEDGGVKTMRADWRRGP